MATKHNHAPNFGRRVADCPRCQELANGSPAIVWTSKREQESAARSREIHHHFNSDFHRSGKCGPVCTFGDW